MVRYLIQRPIAVIMSFIALIIAGLVLLKKIPVSLLPNVDVPQIVVRVDYPNSSAAVIEQNVIRPIRENLVNLNGLKSIESRSANHTGLLYLGFEYNTRMNLAYIEVNEKLDRLANILPRDVQRPQVMRINTSDIPVLRIQVIPKDGVSHMEISDLTGKVLKKRIEQIPGVSLVDINGRQEAVINIRPNDESLHALGLNNRDIVSALQNANRDLGGLSLKDGQYRYFVKAGDKLREANDIAELSLTTAEGTTIPLQRVADISPEQEKQTGYHLFNGNEGSVITVQKQANSRMNELVPAIKKAVEQFETDYPAVDFALTQDQSFLLDAGISNLYQDLMYGGILTIALLFMFLGNWASPTLMSISIPLSLIMTVVFFYLFNISFNIISLSGLALGIGMLIDNSIVVIDNITRKRRTGLSMEDSSVLGTNEVMSPVISQVLTTTAVYAPLILLSGMASALITDQSIALTISLSVSLLVAFVLSPLLYKLLLKRSPEKLKEDTMFYKWVSTGYHKMIKHILKHKLVYFIFTLLAMPLGIWIATLLPISNLPRIEKKESLVQIDWNDPIDAAENLRRIKRIQSQIQPQCVVTEAEVGIKQFLLQQDNNTVQQAELYFAAVNEEKKLKIDAEIRQILLRDYPHASLNIVDAPNAFTQLFTTDAPYLEVKFKPKDNTGGPSAYAGLADILQKMPEVPFRPGAGMITEPGISVQLNYEKMAVYGVERAGIDNALQQLFGIFPITDIKHFGEETHIRLATYKTTAEDKLNSMVTGKNGALYPLRQFISLRYDEQPKFITADRTGPYQSVVVDKADKDIDIPSLQTKVAALAAIHGFSIDFAGLYFENRSQVGTLWTIFFVVLFLLYFILAIQYENLVLPVLVMLTIPLGVAGSMFLLWVTDGTLDVMAAIGFVVVLGLIVDDPTLKIEVLNRMEKQYRKQGLKYDNALLEKMIHEAGDICLKPLLLVSLTTSIAMVPVLLVHGIGNDLQKPMAIVIIGGLTIGTFFTTWFIPIAYWYYMKWKNRRRGLSFNAHKTDIG